MRRSTLWMCALLVTTTFGCEQVKKQAATVGATVKDKFEHVRELVRERFFHKKPSPSQPAPPSVATPAAPQPAAPAPVERAPVHPQPREPVPQIPVGGPARLRDVPYVSQDTGTIFPGMRERDVYSLWGAPAAVRHLGEYTYLFFPNGCEYSCGTMDVVILHDGRVVDAIVRWPGHGYGGQSTSPSGTPSEPREGDNLHMSTDTNPTQPTTPE